MNLTNCTVLIVEKNLFHYRIPFFNDLAKEVKHLTVCHSGDSVNNIDNNFEEVILPTRHVKGFVLQPGLSNLAKQYDVVITKFDMRWFSMMKLNFHFRRNYKIIRWGIGVSSEKGFDKNASKDSARYYFAKKCDALIFYSEYPIAKYVKAGINKDKLFVAPNTIKIDLDHYKKKEGTHFLFVGSLHQRKKIDTLLQAFKLYTERGNKKVLKIIGKGEEEEKIKKLVEKLDLINQVQLLGEVKGNNLNQYFKNAIATISPGQAGLSVLESMGHAVPFITGKDAITGGERLSIVNNENGIIYEGNAKELADILQKLSEDRVFREMLSQNASLFYQEHRQINHMVSAFVEAINFVSNNKKG